MAKDLYKDDAENLKIVRKLLRLKPTRTISGVAPITIFTKPYPCPGQCIFCPSQEGMPKSYLKEEPGAMRGKSLKFDPYEQVKLRMKALSNIGHNVDKIEIIISGGTWSFYEKGYREWFIEQTFKALNELPPSSGVIPDSDPGSRNSKTFLTEEEFSLQELHKMNETAEHRCVGLVIETRPDFINEKEVKHLRSLGVTKVQLGVQSLNSKVLELNKRGHTADDARNAISLLRLAGFKIHIHWMANLYGSSVEEDYEDFKKLFSDKSVRPDELKIYPCSVLENTPLYELMKQGEHIPFSETELVNLLVRCKRHIPQYCRVSRIIRDIPSQLIEGGSKTTNLRQLVQNKLKEQGLACQCIRCREIRNEEFSEDDLVEELLEYGTEVSKEFFLSYTANGKGRRISTAISSKKRFIKRPLYRRVKECCNYSRSTRLRTGVKGRFPSCEGEMSRRGKGDRRRRNSTSRIGEETDCKSDENLEGE